ncbi:MAG TPA: hypothetical protein VN726_12380 [Hanamia sp.]|nr:hypothetical protein [Hanamia sp.]
MIELLKRVLIKRWPLGCLLFCVIGCYQQNKNEAFVVSKSDSLRETEKEKIAFEKIWDTRSLVNNGDLILRTGKDFTSDIMRKLSVHDKTYSHCGIASWENDTLFIYHELGGEFNPDQKLRRDVFEFFCNPYENKGFGIFRYKIHDGQKQNIIKTAHEFYSDHVMFDMKFDMATDDRMYCSEFVFKAIKRATHDSVRLDLTTVNHFTFVAIDNLFINPFCAEIKRVVF